jgi:SAM-dependent methyltransferase
VAAGAGAVLLPAAERVGPHGQVVGVDLAAAMVGRLRQELAARGVDNAAVCRMDAQALGFPGGRFDAVLCGFALDAVPHPQRALAEFHRVLGRVGRLGLTVAPDWWWEVDDRWRWHGELLESLGVRMHGEAAEGRLGTEEVRVAVRAAGFVAVAVAEELFPLVFADAQQWWRWAWSHGYRQVLEAMDQATLECYRAACFERLGVLWGSGAVHGRLKVWLVLANKPSDTDHEGA